MKPKHFKTVKDFSIYILECAIRDRVTYLESITPTSFRDFTEEYLEEHKLLVNDTKSEIAVMKQKLDKLMKG